MLTSKSRFSSFRLRKNLIVFVAVMVFPLMSCSAMQIKPNPLNPIKRIAILPLDNRTAQKKGGQHVRTELLKRLDIIHYEVLPMEKTDEILKKNGFSLKGSNFKNSDLEKLKKAFDVEGLFFGTLLNYNVRQRGELIINEVAGQFWFVDLTKTDELWQGNLGIVSESLLDKDPTLIYIYEEDSEIVPVTPQEIPLGNMDSNFPNNFGQRAKYSKPEENRKDLPEWFKSVFCSNKSRVRLQEKDIENKLACEVDELIERLTWTFPVGPGSPEQ